MFPILLAGLALASTHDRVSSDDLPELLEQIRSRAAGQELTVGVPGFEAHPEVRDLLAGTPLADARVLRISETGTPQETMRRALRTTPCAVRITPQGRGFWRVTEFGDCGTEVRRERPPAPPEAGDEEAHRERPPVEPAEAGAVVVEYEEDEVRPARPVPPSPPGDDLTPLLRNQWELLQVEATLPDQTTAAILSGTVGFGAGHFYAGNQQRGVTHLLLQLGGGLVTGVGVLMMEGATTEGALYGGFALQGLGGLVVTSSRIADVVTAPDSAQQGARRTIQQRRRQLGLD